MELLSGKVNIAIGGSFGSEGKGLLSSYLALTNHVDIAITNCGPNAGHTFYYRGQKHVVKHLPVAGIIQKRNQIYLCGGAIINPPLLLDEIKTHDIDPSRIAIHPRCAIITEDDIEYERDHGSSVAKIAVSCTTMHTQNQNQQIYILLSTMFKCHTRWKFSAAVFCPEHNERITAGRISDNDPTTNPDLN